MILILLNVVVIENIEINVLLKYDQSSQQQYRHERTNLIWWRAVYKVYYYDIKCLYLYKPYLLLSNRLMGTNKNTSTRHLTIILQYYDYDTSHK